MIASIASRIFGVVESELGFLEVCDHCLHVASGQFGVALHLYTQVHELSSYVVVNRSCFSRRGLRNADLKPSVARIAVSSCDIAGSRCNP